MIVLITGLPGAGKTLYTLQVVEEKARKENRPVFYHGIKDLALPWTWFDPTKTETVEIGGIATVVFKDVPPGSIIFIDEGQSTYRPRGNGSVVPPYVALLETHRHAGYDVYITTQHPMLIDNSVRRLAGQHFHVVRTFGMNRATVHEWGAVKENCDKVRTDSIRHEWSYPKEVFKWYKSAEIHTHKRRIPMRLFVLLLGPLVLIALAYGVYKWGFAMVNKAKPEAGVDAPAGDKAKAPAAVPGRESGGRIARTTAAEYVESWKPRIPDLPHSAPIYDGIAAPRTFPQVAACMQSRSKGCKCWSQQATVLDVSKDFCAQVVAKGYFNPFDDPIARQQQEAQRMAVLRAQQPATPPARSADPAPYPAPAQSPSGPPMQPQRQATVPMNSPWRVN